MRESTSGKEVSHSALKYNINLCQLDLKLYTVRTRTNFKKKGFEWTEPKIFPHAITKTNVRTNARLPICLSGSILLA